jgi:hypothetical protein
LKNIYSSKITILRSIFERQFWLFGLRSNFSFNTSWILKSLQKLTKLCKNNNNDSLWMVFLSSVRNRGYHYFNIVWHHPPTIFIQVNRITLKHYMLLHNSHIHNFFEFKCWIIKLIADINLSPILSRKESEHSLTNF